jgi:anti-anti-sigma regulatory factor
MFRSGTIDLRRFSRGIGMARTVDSTIQEMLITAPAQFTARSLLALDRLVDDAISQHTLVVDVDMAAVEGVDSAALNWLLTTQDRLTVSEIALRLIRVRSLVEDILLATRLDGRFTVLVAASEEGRNA